MGGPPASPGESAIGRGGERRAVMFRRRTGVFRLLLLLYIIIGIFVAFDRNYITESLLKGVLSALLAIFLWFLVLLGVDLKID
jgi:hypothetical protein